MPSLEIVCINQSEPSDFSDFPFRVDSEKELVSHRSPSPLFQVDFDSIQGCIYHLLDEGNVTSYDLLVRDWHDDNETGVWAYNVQFRDEYAPFLKQMLEQLLLDSPLGQVLFTTDYQFGPDVERHGPISFSEFWSYHDAGQVQMNKSYLITRTSSTS